MHILAHATPSKGPGGDFQHENSDKTSFRNSILDSLPSRQLGLLARLLRWLKRGLVALGFACAFAAVAIGLTPAALSHPTGLRVALGLVNTVSPIHLEVDNIIAGWQKPLQVHGVRIKEKGTLKRKHRVPGRKQEYGEKQKDRFSGAQAPNGAANSLMQQVSTEVSGKKGIPIQSGDGTTDQDEERSSGTISTGTGTTLISFNRLQTTTSLWSIFCQNPSDVIISDPHFNVTLNPLGNLRIVQTLQDAGLTPMPRGAETRLPPQSSSPQQKPEAAVEGESAAAAAAAIPVVPLSLQRVSEEVPFSGEVRMGNCHVVFTSGRLLAPMGLHDILGDTTHFEILVGSEKIEEEALEEESRAGFVGDKEGETSSLGEWARHTPVVELPEDVGVLTSPVSLRLDSQRVKCLMAGWRTSQGFTFLAAPLEAQLDLTPKLARALLTRLNPLLGTAVELQGSSQIAAWVTPCDGLWPSPAVDLRLEAMKLKVGKGAALNQGLEVLKLVSPKIADAAKAASLQVETSPLRAEIASNGEITAKRLDISIGIPGLARSLQFVSWGTANASPSGNVDMTLAIPANTLAMVGIQGLPEDFGVPISVSGRVDAPRLELFRATKEVTLLVIETKAKQLGPRAADWMWEELRLGGDRKRFRIPMD